MNKKLTLSINEEVIRFAHEYAKETHQSVSEMVEVYFSQLMKEDKFKEFSKETTVLYGILRNNPLPDKKEMRRDFHEKSTH